MTDSPDEYTPVPEPEPDDTVLVDTGSFFVRVPRNQEDEQ